MDKQFITAQITEALRNHDKSRVSILRQVKNEIDTKEKATGVEMTPEEVTGALKKVLKQTSETLEASEKAGTDEERTAHLREQVDILAGYLPEQVTGEELGALVAAVFAESGFSEKRDMGRAIAAIVEKTGGNVDKAEVAKLVGSKLG